MMKRLPKPNLAFTTVFDDCVSGISDQHLTARFAATRQLMIASNASYDQLASVHGLGTLAACTRGNPLQIILGNLTKGELKKLYSTNLVGATQPARTHYDGLMMHAPLGKCPYCGFGQVSTLDHFLSQSYYPSFSVLASNLVPACADCNKTKGAGTITPQNQALHPYFEPSEIEAEPWLFATVTPSRPVTLYYYISPPSHWPAPLRQRTRNHFWNLNLAHRFSIEAASELASISDNLDDLLTFESRQQHLSKIARIERRRRTNSWKAALYEALSNNDWFIQSGYRHRAV